MGIRAGALLTGALAAAAMAVGCGSSGSSGSAETVNLATATPPAKAAAANFGGIHSGEIELRLETIRFGKKNEQNIMKILGTFLKAGEEPLPQVDLAIQSYGELAGHNIQFLSGPLLRADKWVVNFAGKVYEPGQTAFEELKSKLEEAQGEAGGEGNAMACVEAAEGFEVTDFLHKISYEGKSEALDGTKVESVGAEIDVSALIDALAEMRDKSRGCEAQLEALDLPSSAKLEELAKELKNDVASSRLSLALDKNGVPRYFKAVVNVELPHGEELEIELVMRLNQVNEETELPNAHGYSPYPALLKQFGLTSEDVEQAEGGEIWVGVLGALADRMLGREGG